MGTIYCYPFVLLSVLKIDYRCRCAIALSVLLRTHFHLVVFGLSMLSQLLQ
jgi:hypothetical protein